MNVEVGLAGRKRAVVKKANTGEVVHDTGWSRNLIVNQGLDNYCSGGFIPDKCGVGTSNTAPAATQTTLGAQVGALEDTMGFLGGSFDETEGYVGYTYRWEFPEGFFSGENLAEVGIFSSANELLSRSLFLDEFGDPTTITVLSDEILWVYYEVRTYFPTTPVTAIVVDSTTGVSHTTNILASNIDNITSSSADWGTRGLGTTSGVDSESDRDYASSGSVTNVLNFPDGTSLGQVVASFSKNSYTDGDYYREMTMTIPVDSVNDPGGIGALMIPLGNTTWAVDFNPKIMKTSSDKLEVTIRVDVTRASI